MLGPQPILERRDPWSPAQARGRALWVDSPARLRPEAGAQGCLAAVAEGRLSPGGAGRRGAGPALREAQVRGDVLLGRCREPSWRAAGPWRAGAALREQVTGAPVTLPEQAAWGFLGAGRRSLPVVPRCGEAAAL